MNFIRNRNFRAGPQTSLEGFICPQNSDKKQKIKVFGRSGGGKFTDNHNVIVFVSLMWLYTTPQSYDFFLKLARISGVFSIIILHNCKKVNL